MKKNYDVDEVLNSPRLLNLPLLLLANKQDNPTSLSVSEIRESFEAWNRSKQSKKQIESQIEEEQEEEEGNVVDTSSNWDDGGAKEERMASLDVMGVSALEG